MILEAARQDWDPQAAVEGCMTAVAVAGEHAAAREGSTAVAQVVEQAKVVVAGNLHPTRKQGPHRQVAVEDNSLGVPASDLLAAAGAGSSIPVELARVAGGVAAS